MGISRCLHCLTDDSSRQKRFLNYEKSFEDLPIVFDSGANVLVTPPRKDFKMFTPATAKFHNISGNILVLGSGVIKLDIYDNKVHYYVIWTLAYLLPNSCVCLFSIQTFLGQNKDSFVIEEAKGYFNLMMHKN